MTEEQTKKIEAVLGGLKGSWGTEVHEDTGSVVALDDDGWVIYTVTYAPNVGWLLVDRRGEVTIKHEELEGFLVRVKGRYGVTVSNSETERG